MKWDYVEAAKAASQKARQTAQDALRTTIRRKPGQYERREQEAVKRLLRALGAKFWVAGTVRRIGDYHGTMQTPGLPDLPLVFLPRHKLPGYATGDGMPFQLVVIEVKSPAAAKSKNGGLRPEQHDLLTFCGAAGVPYLHGDLNAIIAWLVEQGYLRASQLPHYRVPK